MHEHPWIWEYEYKATGYFASYEDALADAERALHPSRIPDVRIVQVVAAVAL